jgi:hypothetical protein
MFGHRRYATMHDTEAYIRRARAIYERTLTRIAVAIDNLGEAEREASFHRRCVEEWRRTLNRPRP